MLLIHGFIFLAVFVGIHRKKVDKKIGLLILCGNLLGTAITIWGMLEEKQPVTELERRYGEIQQVELEAETGSGKREQVILQIPELTRAPSEVEQLLQEKLQELDGIILGKNRSLQEIRSDLNLPETFSDSPVTVSWSTSNPEILDRRGRPGAEIPEAGEEVVLEGELSLQGESMIYSRILKVYPAGEEEELARQLEREAEKINENEDGTAYRLPDTAGGESVRWFQKRETPGIYVAVLFLTAGVLLAVSRKNESRKQEQKIREEMKREYPEIISRIQLLMSAGLGMRKIFEKIALDYGRQLREPGGVKKPAYEEIAAVYYEMAGGASELEAYEHLGARSRLSEFKNLSVLLIQNLKKGRRELGSLLEQEVRAALEERRRTARAEGEKAGTRLLLPMGMMLLVVLILMMVPAFLSI